MAFGFRSCLEIQGTFQTPKAVKLLEAPNIGMDVLIIISLNCYRQTYDILLTAIFTYSILLYLGAQIHQE